MYCTGCGKKISDEANYCQYCGKKIEKSGAESIRLEEKHFIYDSTFILNKTSVPEINQWFSERRIVLKNASINIMLKTKFLQAEMGIAEMLLQYETPSIPEKGYRYYLHYFTKIRGLSNPIGEVREMMNEFSANPDVIVVWSNLYQMTYKGYGAIGFVIYRKKSELPSVIRK